MSGIAMSGIAKKASDKKLGIIYPISFHKK